MTTLTAGAGAASSYNNTTARRRKRRRHVAVVVRNPWRLPILFFVALSLDAVLTQFETQLHVSDSNTEIDPILPKEQLFMKEISAYIPRLRSGRVCLTEKCITQVASHLARAFPKPRQWCFPAATQNNNASNKENNYYGFIMVKVPKSASSTAAAVTLRIQNRYYNRTQTKCQVEYNHRLATSYNQASTAANSFMWSSVRHPTPRALSRVFFSDISFKKQAPTDSNILKALGRTHEKFGSLSMGQGGFQLRYLSTKPIPEQSAWTMDTTNNNANNNNSNTQQDVLHPERVLLSVKRIMDQYGFLALVERMDESLVLLSMLLDLDLTDILVASNSKVAGSGYFQSFDKCVMLTKRVVSSSSSTAVDDYLQSNSWLGQNYGDLVLHKAINMSLDKTLKETFGGKEGKIVFARKLHELQRLFQLYTTHCSASTILPCSQDGKLQRKASQANCYEEDYGCGYTCIDNTLLLNHNYHTQEELDIWKPMSSLTKRSSWLFG